MDFFDFLNLLDSQLEKVLSAEEFRCTGKGLFVRLKGEVIHSIQIQKHSEKSACCINLGVHFAFVPTVGTDQLPQIDRIEVSDCEIKIRLTPTENQKDHWWVLNDESVSEIVDVIQSRGLPIFNQYGVEKLALLSPADFQVELPRELMSMTRVRAVLLLARLNLYIGRPIEAGVFANFGLKVAGMAVGPKVAFKEILKHIED